MANRAKGNRKGKKTRHISVTDMASQVYSHLLANGVVSYPGPISQRGGGGAQPRITLATENTRYRITIANSGTQTLYVYGVVDHGLLQNVLKQLVGDGLRLRDART
jgi:hypothetical protein